MKKKRETLSKTIRISQKLNEEMAEISSQTGISINKFISCSCAHALSDLKTGKLEVKTIIDCGREYDEFNN